MATQHRRDPAKPAVGVQDPYTSQARGGGTAVVSVPQVRWEELVRMGAPPPPAVTSLKSWFAHLDKGSKDDQPSATGGVRHAHHTSKSKPPKGKGKI